MLHQAQFVTFGSEPDPGPLTLLEMIQREGLTSGLQLCLDAADSASYSGSGQSWLDTSGNGYDFFRGATSGSEASDPTFNGSAGGLSANEYWSNDGGDRFTYDTTVETWMSNLHKDNAMFACIVAFNIPSGAFTGDEEIRLIDTRGGGGNTGVQARARRLSGSPATSGNFHWAFEAFNGGTRVNDLTQLEETADGSWHIGTVSWDETNGTSGGRIGLNGAINVIAAGGTYSVPDNGNAGQPMRFFENARSGTRLGALAIWEGTIPTITQLVSLSDRLNARYGAY